MVVLHVFRAFDTRIFADSLFVFLFSHLVAEAEVAVPHQDVHIVITTEHESAAGLQPIIGGYSVWLNSFIWVWCDPSNVSRLQTQLTVG